MVTRVGLVLLGTVIAGLAAASIATAQGTMRPDRVVVTTRVVIGGSTFGSTSPLQVIGLPALTGTILTVDGSGNIGTSGTATAAALTVTNAFATQGNSTLGNGTGDDITLTGRIAASIGWKTDNTHDLGATGANRPRDLWLGRNAAIGGTLDVTGNTTLTGDLAVNGNDLTSTGVLTIRPTGNLTLDPTGDIVIGADGLDVLPATGYTYNLGALTNKYLTLHAAELWVETLVAQDTIATIGGRILVGPTTTLTSDLASGATTMNVKHNSLANGDRVYLEANGSVEFIAVASAASGTGPYSYTITRNLDASGANDWYAGDAVFNTGTTGDGFIDLYSVRGVKAGTEYGPTIVGNVRASATYNDWAPRWAAGNLNGLYGYATDVYGFAAGNPSDTYFTIDASNGFQIYDGATKKFWLTTSGAMALYDSATTYLQLTGGAIKMVEGGTERVSIASGGTLVLGDAAIENVRLTSTALEFRTGTTVLGSLDGSTLTLGQPLTANNTGQIVIDSSSLAVNWRNNAGTTVQPFFVQSDATSSYVIVENWEFRGSTLESYSDANMTIASGGTFNTITVRGGAGGAGDVILYGPQIKPNANNTQSLGTSALAWSELYLAPATTTTDYNPLVLGASGQVLEKTDGVSATFNPTTCTSMTFHSGLLVAKAGC